MIVYLDLNIFDKIEKFNTLELADKENYQTLLNLLTSKKITTAYSNAHLNDLFRGFQKNPNYINGHLKNIEVLTNNLCICQYWGKQTAEWHYRNIFDFFSQKQSDWELEPQSFSDLFQEMPLMQQIFELYKHITLPNDFKKGYQDPFFGIMFPLSKVHNTQYALHEDIFNFQIRLKSDYGLYKALKSYLVIGVSKIKNNQELMKSLSSTFKDLPKHLEAINVFDAYTPNSKTSDNSAYSKVIDSFFKYDLSGYKTDGHFNNMFDDALHSFYASHFDFFITNDDRCKYKAEKTYDRLKIKTTVIKIGEIDNLKESL